MTGSRYSDSHGIPTKWLKQEEGDDILVTSRIPDRVSRLIHGGDLERRGCERLPKSWWQLRPESRLRFRGGEGAGGRRMVVTDHA